MRGILGWQIGFLKTDIIPFIKTRHGIDKTFKGDLTLGVEISVIADPSRRSVAISTNLETKADIYSCFKIRGKGLLAGISR